MWLTKVTKDNSHVIVVRQTALDLLEPNLNRKYAIQKKKTNYLVVSILLVIPNSFKHLVCKSKKSHLDVHVCGFLNHYQIVECLNENFPKSRGIYALKGLKQFSSWSRFQVEDKLTKSMKIKKIKKKKNRKVQEKTQTEDFCFRCAEGGHLMMCDVKTCSKVYHLACLNLEAPPRGKVQE